MNRITQQVYENMPWSGSGSSKFEKPHYSDIEYLKGLPLYKRKVEYSEYYELQTYLDIVDGDRDGKLLDLGAGTGNLSYLFDHLNFDVTACDIDKKGFVPAHIPFVEFDLNNPFPFSDSTFDYIISKQTIEHLISPYRFINEIGRVLKKGGTVVLSTPNTSSLKSRWNMLKHGLPRGFADSKWNYGGHMSPVFYKQIQAFMEAANIGGIEFFSERYSLYNLSSVNGRKMRFLAPFLKLFSHNDIPEACLYGDKLIVKGTKQR